MIDVGMRKSTREKSEKEIFGKTKRRKKIPIAQENTRLRLDGYQVSLKYFKPYTNIAVTVK